MIIKIAGDTDFILNYLLTHDNVIVIEYGNRIKDSPVIKFHISPPPGEKQEYLEKIIRGEKIDGIIHLSNVKTIAVEAPVEINETLLSFPGTIIVFENCREKPNIKIIGKPTKHEGKP